MDYSILDVGCRGKELKSHLENMAEYQGIDLVEAPEVLAHDLEQPIPFQDRSFDVVTALDVVEHLENPHQLMEELVRVAARAVIVSLPNMYHWSYRLKFLRGHVLGGKYVFSSTPLKDRHRWLPSYLSAVEFVKANIANHPVEIFPLVPDRRRFKLLKIIEHMGKRIWPNVFTYHVLFFVDVTDSES